MNAFAPVVICSRPLELCPACEHYFDPLIFQILLTSHLVDLLSPLIPARALHFLIPDVKLASEHCHLVLLRLDDNYLQNLIDNIFNYTSDDLIDIGRLKINSILTMTFVTNMKD